MTFEEQLAFGQMGESLIAQWLRRRGYNILPAYEKEIDNGKGPRLFTASSEYPQLVAPDLFVMGNGKFMWIEAKHKTRFSWYGKRKCWVTGIDLHHYEDYCRVADVTDLPVWLLFLHRDNHASLSDVNRWGAPRECPVGLFGEEVSFLRRPVNQSHTSGEYGSSGMIYWRHETLRHIAPVENLIPGIIIEPISVPMQPQREQQLAFPI